MGCQLVAEGFGFGFGFFKLCGIKAHPFSVYAMAGKAIVEIGFDCFDGVGGDCVDDFEATWVTSLVF